MTHRPQGCISAFSTCSESCGHPEPPSWLRDKEPLSHNSKKDNFLGCSNYGNRSWRWWVFYYVSDRWSCSKWADYSWTEPDLCWDAWEELQWIQLWCGTLQPRVVCELNRWSWKKCFDREVFCVESRVRASGSVDEEGASRAIHQGWSVRDHQRSTQCAWRETLDELSKIEGFSWKPSSEGPLHLNWERSSWTKVYLEIHWLAEEGHMTRAGVKVWLIRNWNESQSFTVHPIRPVSSEVMKTQLSTWWNKTVSIRKQQQQHQSFVQTLTKTFCLTPQTERLALPRHCLFTADLWQSSLSSKGRKAQSCVKPDLSKLFPSEEEPVFLVTVH